MFAASEARADQPTPPVRHVEVREPPRTQGDDLDVSYTSSPFLALRIFPLRLLGGVGQVGAELRILPKFSLLAQFGYGRVTTKNPLTFEPQRQSYTELEAQGRFYAIGGIQGGLYAGAGLTYAVVDTDQLIPSPLLNLSSGVHVVPHLGGNYSFPFNLLIDLQFLFPYRVHSSAPSTPTAPGVDRALPFRIGVALSVGYLF
jgi:hypothetical protein